MTDSVFSLFAERAARRWNIVSAAHVVVFEGDSRTSEAGCFPFIYGGNASPAVLGINKAASGSTLSDLVSRSDEMTMVPLMKSGAQRFIAIVGPVGANDLSSYAGATDTIAATAYAATMAAYTDSLYDAGFDDVVLCTELPTTNSTHNTRRNILNPIYTDAYPGEAVTICDFAADATMGPDAAASDTNLYSDGTHPTATGQANLEAVIRSVLNGLMETPEPAQILTAENAGGQLVESR